jgi:hypothetical protein
MTRRNATVTFLALCLVVCGEVASLSPLSHAEETIYLQSGQQYEARAIATSDSSITADVAGQSRVFPLDDVLRVDFQKVRAYDGLTSTDALLAAAPEFADALSVSTEALQKAYPQAGYVVLQSDAVISISPDGKYQVDRTQIWRILEQRGADSSFQSLSFLPDRQQVEVVYGLTAGPDGKVAHVSDASSKLEAVYPQFPEYNFLRRLRFSMKNPVPGATLFLKTRVAGTATQLRPLRFEQVFRDTEPAVNASVTLTAGVDTLKSTSIQSSGGLQQSKEGSIWRVKNAPQILPEPIMPPVAAFAPRLVIVYPISSWGDVAREFVKTLDAAPIQSPPGTTVAGAYNKVRRDIRTIGIPQDSLPNPPASPADVLKRGYGNNVEKAFLLAALLNGLGNEAHVVLTSGRSNGPLLTQAPTIRGFDDVLVRLKDPDGSDTWLQVDDRLAAFGELATDDQGARGLDLAAGEIVDVPARPAAREGVTRTVNVALETDGGAIVTDTYRLSGRQARAFRGLSDMSDDQMRKWAADFVGSDLAGVELRSWSHSDFRNANNEEDLVFNYRIPNLAEVAGGFLVLRLPNAKFAPTDVGRPTRMYDLFWLGRDSADITFTVRAPAGYVAYAVGEPISWQSKSWQLQSSFEKRDEGRTVVFTEQWRRDALEAPKEDYKDYRQALILRGVGRNSMIVFEKKAD